MSQRSRARAQVLEWIGAACFCAAMAGAFATPVSAGGEPRADAPPVPAAPPAPAAPAPVPYWPVPLTPRTPHAHPGRGSRVLRVLRGDDDERVRIDTLIVVQPGAKLEIFNFGGDVSFRTWTRNAVRLSVERSSDDRVAIARSGNQLKIESVSREGQPQDMDFHFVVPAWLPVALTGVNNDVSAEGLSGGLQVETVHGDIVARHLTGAIDLHSVEGVVDLVNARGKIDVSSVNDAVRLAEVAGEISADAVNGDVHLVGIDSRKVEATSVSGDVVYDAPLQAGGSYSFSTHDGDIAVGLSDLPNATVNVSTFGGDFASAFAIKPERSAKGKRLHFTLGNGGANMNLESFQGSIELLRSGQGELRRKMVEATRARQEALQKWGEWNPARRMEWKEKQEKAEKVREMARQALHEAEHEAEHEEKDKDEDKP